MNQGGGKRFGGGGGKRFGSGGGGKRFGGGGGGKRFGSSGGGKRFGSKPGFRSERFGGENRERSGPARSEGGPPREFRRDGPRKFDRSGGSEGPRRFDRGAGEGPRKFERGGGAGGPRKFDRGGGEGGPRKFERGSGEGGPRKFERGTGEGGPRKFERSGSGPPKRFGRFGAGREEPRDKKPFRHGDRRGFTDASDRRAPAPGFSPPGDGERTDSTSRFVFGVNPALEALRARPQGIERLYYDGSMNPSVAGEVLSRAKDANVRTDQVPREKLNSLAEGGVHQGLVLEMREYQYVELSTIIKDKGLVVVLDSLQDPQNVGAIIRSANAFGAAGVVIAKDRAAAITGAVVKASAGATEHTKIARVTNLSRALEELKEAGYWSVAADPSGDPLGSKPLDGPLAIVIGSEGPGVRQGVLSHCDFKVRIPMLGDVASLNASVSAGILLYEIARQRAARPES